MDNDSKILTEAYLTKVVKTEGASPFPPIRNEIWEWDSLDNEYTTEASMFRDPTQHTDPWNRPLPQMNTWMAKRDREGEILFWRTTTTVGGQPVKLVIFND